MSEKRILGKEHPLKTILFFKTNPLYTSEAHYRIKPPI